MAADPAATDSIDPYRRLLQRLVAGGIPAGDEFDTCRAVLGSRLETEIRFQAACMLLEGALADPSLAIDDTRQVVDLLKALARGTIAVEELV